jgi:uncharacterized membrane protein
LLVTLTGWFEIIDAVGIISLFSSEFASVGLALMLLFIFPANIHAAREGIAIAGKLATQLGFRTVLQIVFLAAILIAGSAS